MYSCLIDGCRFAKYTEHKVGFNHSTSYSMIGYTCAYLRYYHPFEFTTAFFNMAQNDEDINMGVDLAKSKNIVIKDVTFGFSIDKYTYSNGVIYKGMDSIKYINNKTPIELNKLYKKSLSFPKLINEIQINTKVNSRQLETLIKINYFQEYGSIGKLLKYIEYIGLLKNKTYLKEKLDKKLEYFIKDFSELYTVKTTGVLKYRKLDKEKIFEKIWNELEYDEIDIIDKISWELDLLGYVKEVPNNISLAKVEMVSTKNRSANLKSFRSNETRWFKFKKNEVSMVSKGDIIIIEGIYKKRGWKGREDLYIKKYKKINLTK